MATTTEYLSGSLQDNVLTLLLFSDAGHSVVRASVEVNLFTSRVYRDIVHRAYTYIDRYGKPPKEHIADELEDMLGKKDEHADLLTAVLKAAKDLSETLNERYVLDSLERFIRQQALKVGIVRAHELVQRGLIDDAEQALNQALKARAASFSPGLRLKETIKLLQQGDQFREVMSLGIKELDRLQLGPAKQEYHLLLAPAKRGKSWWLQHCTKRGLMQGWRGVYITLELSDRLVGRRMLQALFSVKTRDEAEVVVPRFVRNDEGKLETIEQVKRNRPSIERPSSLAPYVEKIDSLHIDHRLYIKHFPTNTLTPRGIDAYLDQLDDYGFWPDFIIVDYAELMKIDELNYRISIGALHKELRRIAVERNAALINVSQGNRPSASARLVTERHAAEDWSKIGTADCVLTYNQTLEEHRRGLARIYVASGRFEADRFSVVVAQNYATGQFALDSFGMIQEYWEHVEEEEADRGSDRETDEDDE